MIFLLAIFLLLTSPARGQEVYKWKDAKGQWRFGQQPPDTGEWQGPDRETVLRNDLKRQIDSIEKKLGGKIVIDDAVIRSCNSYSNYLCVDGKVRNAGDRLSQWIKVNARAFDQGGKLLRVEWTYSDPHHILPGQTATFQIRIENSFEPYRGLFEVELLPDWRGRLTEEKLLVRNPYFRY